MHYSVYGLNIIVSMNRDKKMPSDNRAQQDVSSHLVLIHVEFNSIKVTYGIWNISELIVRQVNDI